MDLKEAKSTIHALHISLREAAKRDPNQEVEEYAIRMLDGVMRAAMEHVPKMDPVREAYHDLISPETIATGMNIRAFDAALVAEQLELALDRALAKEPYEPMQVTLEPGPFDDWKS